MSLQEKIIQEIKTAFKDVTLVNGIGLSEANAIDDYEDQNVRDKCRMNDEKKNWEKISSEALNKYNCALSYFDAEGMRFHIPAFIISDLKGEYRFGVVFALTNLSDYSKSQFLLLTNEQKHAISSYLQYLLTQDEYKFERETIRYALENYWTT